MKNLLNLLSFLSFRWHQLGKQMTGFWQGLLNGNLDQVRLPFAPVVFFLAMLLATSSRGANFYISGYTETNYGSVGTTYSNGFGSIVHAADGSIYVAGGFNNKVYYSAPGSGTFTPLVDIGNTALGLALSGNILYIGSESNRILKVNLTDATPTAVLVGTISGSAPQALAIAPSGWGSHGGKLLIGSGSGIFVMDLTTGTSSQLVSAGPVPALAFTPGGELLAIYYYSDAIFKVNPNGTASSFAATVASGPDGLAVHPSTGKVYVFCSGSPQIREISTDGSSNVLFADGVSFDGGYYPCPAAFNANGSKLFYGTTGGGLPIKAISGFPSLQTLPATGVSTTAGTLNGSTYSSGLESNAWFEWGTSPTLNGAASTAQQAIGSGMDAVAFSHDLTGLVRDTTYYFRAMMSNSTGTKVGSILSFTTGPEILVEEPVGTSLTDGAATVSFLPGQVGATSTAKTVTIKNVGAFPLTDLTVTKDGAHANDFTVSALSGTTLAPGASMTFTVTITPGALGARSAALHIASNDADENPFDINLSGSGVSYAPGYNWSGNVAGVNSNNYYYDFSYGSEFTPTESVQLTHLGVYDHNQDGLSSDMQVKLWNSNTQQELAFTTVRAGTVDTLIGSSRYRELALPITLEAGTRYVVAAYYKATYNWGVTPEPFGTGTSITTDSRITYNGSAYYTPTVYTYDWWYAYYYGYYYYYYEGYYFSYPYNKSSNSASSASYFGANFLLQSAAPTNAAPIIARTNAAVTVNEGTQASNSGTFSDAQGNGTVTLTASLGTLTKNDAAGTWSWTHTPEDGPAGPTAVTITATDNGSPPLQSTATFNLSVDNVAPSYDLGANVFLTAANFSATVSFSDPGADTWSGTVNYGDGTGNQALSINGPARTFSLSHTFAQAGVYTVTTTLNDDDGGSLSDTVAVDVILKPTFASATASLVTAYTAHLSSSVRPNRGTTSAYYQYSPDSTFTAEVLTTTAQDLGNSSSFVPHEADLSQLKADTQYFFRVVAENASGISTGSTFSFRTLPPVVSDVYMNVASGLKSTGEIYRPIPGVINAAGRISFKAFGAVGVGGTTTANDAWLMSDTSGSLRLIGQEGIAVPGGGLLSGTFNNLVLSPGGRTVTIEKIAATTVAKDQGYLISENGSILEILSREGDGANGGGLFIGHTGRHAVDENDRVYVPGALGGVVTTKNSGIWYDAAGSLGIYAKEGLNVTSLVGDLAWLGNVSLTLSAAGDGVAFTAALQNNPDNTAQKTLTARNAAIFSGAPGAIELVARKGDLIPSIGKLSSFNGVSRGAAGDHAFLSLMTLSSVVPVVTSVNDQALFAEVDGIISLVARENTTELIAGIKVARFGDFYMTSESEVIFQSWVTGAGVTTANDSILCRWTEGAGIEVLAREGAAAPGTGVNYGAFQTLSVSPGGAVALQSTLTNGRIALMRAMPGAGLGLVVQTTQTVMFGPSLRTILSLGINSTGTGSGGGGGGLGDAINDEGAIFTVLSIGSSDYVGRIYKP